MELREQLNGIQHVGIPTNDIEMTIAFYEKLGFEIAFRTVNEAADEKVAFLKLGTLAIETYENKAAALKPGAIDHVAIDVKNIEKVHEMITGAGLNTTQDEVHFLRSGKMASVSSRSKDQIKKKWNSASICNDSKPCEMEEKSRIMLA